MYDGNPGEITFGSSYRGFELLGVNCITIGIPKAWSGFRSGISTGNMLILRTFKINANDDTADNHRSRIQGNRKASIHQSAMCLCSPAERAPHPEALMLQNVFFLLWKQPQKLFCPFNAKHGFFTKEAISINYFWSSWDWELYCWPRRLKFKMVEITIHLTVISSECTHIHKKIF